ncbi:guanine nucleotide-binding protein g(o) subunit alpha [Anaeramoeba flamelloides]|uniref:Guanine nucleotide-binding protein g(O) subunit alpha n=1 Tax=Anaeramoeba flamelloides TaxID=1746091 RepID=A0ABQ8XBN3_9EUKA|nr:guanine nucleotide-binding protein g(o) subunit alpha [Anaeramoeba flamelloides]
MGNKDSKKEKKEQKLNKKVKNKLQSREDQLKKQHRIIVLGTGESGKSTFIKQLSILFQGGFTKQEKELFAKTIQKNLIINTKILLKATTELGIEITKESKEIAKTFVAYEDLNEESLNAIIELWKDTGFKEAYERRSEFQLPDTANYFLDNAERVSKEGYMPNDFDILSCRIPTTGVNEIDVDVDESNWLVIDVGGQRSERRKWIHQFDNVSIVIYVIALSEYNQKLFEDEEVNRLRESLLLFEKTINNDHFKKTNCILLLNKMDLFEKKIKQYPFKDSFTEYEDENEVDPIIEFISNKFKGIGENKFRTIGIHRTSATNTEMMKDNLNIIKKHLPNKN